jgi:hypothetical protein
MNDISKSPQRHTFQMERYVERCKQEGKEIVQEYIDMFLDTQKESMSKFDKPESRIDNLEYDLRTTEWILEKARNNKTYAQNLYAAMCNNEFVKNDVWPILSDKRWSCSWRYAGGIIADMLEKGDYIDWYCSGIRGGHDMGGGPPPSSDGFAGEGEVTEEISQDLLKLGWIVIQDDK